MMPSCLSIDDNGAIRVGGTHVTLDTVIETYMQGEPPEEIIRSYDTLKLADVQAVIAYYEQHREEVEAYLDRRRQEADEIRRKIKQQFPSEWIRERLLARRAKNS